MVSGSLQINNFRGEKVVVHMKNGDHVIGGLAFFNYDDQIIHLEDYKIISPEEGAVEAGRFTVINKSSWTSLNVEEE